MTATTLTYKEQRQLEARRTIARTKCHLCKEPIGSNKYVVFEDRYFHLSCLRKEH